MNTTTSIVEILTGTAVTNGIAIHQCGSQRLADRVITEIAPEKDVTLTQEGMAETTSVERHYSAIAGGNYWSALATVAVRDAKTMKIIGRLEGVRVMNARIPA